MPSAREMALGKEPFADKVYVECSLPSATFDKGFAECIWCFAECIRHSSKTGFPVVVADQSPIVFGTESKYSLAEILFSKLNQNMYLHPHFYVVWWVGLS